MIDESYTDKLNKPIMKLFEDYNIHDSFKDWIIQRKWDGFRCLLDSGWNISQRLLNDHGSYKDMQFPDIVEQISEKVQGGCILDGEMIVELPFHVDGPENGFPFVMSRQATRERIKIKLLRMKYPATYMAFDILKYEGNDCRDLPTEDRMLLLDKAVKSCKEIRTVTDFGLDTAPQLKERCIKNNYEGIVLKPKGENYYADWFKLKAWQETEYEITNVESTGQRLISTITVDCENPTNVKWQGEQTKQVRDTLIGMKVLVRYLQPVKAGGKLRFPNMVELIP